MVLRVPPLGQEKESLQAALTRHRDVIRWKVSGLSDSDLRRAVLPSGGSLLGLVKHLAFVEYGWFCQTFGRPMEPAIDELDKAVETDPEADLTIFPGETTAEVMALWERSLVAADAALAELDLDEVGTSWSGDAVSMRWVAIHMVEEVCRHAGHIDVMRELIDGLTGDHDRS